MRDPLVETLYGIASSITKFFGTEDEAHEPLRELMELLDEADISNQHGWTLPDSAEVTNFEVLGAVWLALGMDHPAGRLLVFPESASGSVVVEEDFSVELWRQAQTKYSRLLLSAMDASDEFSPESLFDGTVGDPDTGERTAVPVSTFMAAAFCNVAYLALADAALGDRDGVEAKRPLLELMIRRNVYIIGFADEGRTVLVPVRG